MADAAREGSRAERWSIVAAICLFAQVPAVAQEQVQSSSADESLTPYGSTAHLVQLPDGRDLHFVCMGKGTPTVILTAGMGDLAMSAWRNLQPEIARFTRVCTWDRPGFGLSDGASWAQTVDATTSDLETGLMTGGIAGPYVMVGHSLGAYESLLFADRNPGATAGMVLVDPSVPDQLARAGRIAPALAQPIDPSTDPLVQFLRRCAEDVRRGAAKDGGPDPNGCFAYPPSWPPALRAALAAHASEDSLVFHSVASHLTSFPEDARLVINAERDYGDMPLIVLTATLSPIAADASLDVIAQTPLWAEEWNRAHDELAALSRRGVNTRVPGADHYIQESKPQVVLDAIQWVVGEARKPVRR